MKHILDNNISSHSKEWCDSNQDNKQVKQYSGGIQERREWWDPNEDSNK